jgi:hypothetical protein
MENSVTYVYCVVAAARRPALPKRLAHLPGLGPPRVLDLAPGLWLVVANASGAQFGGEAVNRRLSDLDWVSRVAIAHEAVVDALLRQRAVLPMKLFTIFIDDERALAHMRAERGRIGGLVKLVANREEWGVRVTRAETRWCGRHRQTRAPPRDRVRIPDAEEGEPRRRASARPDRAPDRGRSVRSPGVAGHAGAAPCRTGPAARGRTASARRSLPGSALGGTRVSSAGGARRPPTRARRVPAGADRSLAALHVRERLKMASRQIRKPRSRPVAEQVLEPDEASVLDLLDRLLDKGVNADGDLTLGVAGVDLIYMRLSALLCAADRVLPRNPAAPTRAPRRARLRSAR